MEGRLLIFSAPSGSGKSTIVGHLLTLDLGLAFSISATSRKPREGEVNGKEYLFIAADRFRDLIDQDAFIEWEEVYPDQYYGTLRSGVEQIWNQGKHALFDIDVMGGLYLKERYGTRALAIFVQPPSLEELASRLRKRGKDDEASLRERLGKAESEMQLANRFDHILVNDVLEDSLSEAERLVKDFLSGA